MKPFRKHVAISIDGGGIRGVIVTKALSIMEAALHKNSFNIFSLAAGTSTGAIIAAGIASGLTAELMTRLYDQLGDTIFRKSWRSFFWPLTKYRYSSQPLMEILTKYMGDRKMGNFWETSPRFDLIITTFDLVENRPRFIKPWKEEYADMPVVEAVLASSSIPTYFPVVDGRFVDGGIGSYSNPCFLAAYELQNCLGWKLEETTLISLGTGRNPNHIQVNDPSRYSVLDWIDPLVDAFAHSADDQQIHLVETFFRNLDFRRFQVDLEEDLPVDDPKSIPVLIQYGEKMGQMILDDAYDRALGNRPDLEIH